jgi:thymidylate synthase
MNYDNELAYRDLVSEVYNSGEIRKTRNSITKSLFGGQLVINDVDKELPLLTSRKMYPRGILGEFAAMINGPKSIKDFEKFGCNYWKLWADKDGKLELDYGNAWLDFNGVNQIDKVIETLKTNPTDRRMLITGWRPDRLNKLSLPCCHYAYQFYVREGKYLDILWVQRSVDVMVGLPSDILLAALWIITLAKEVGLIPGRITMSLGDCHIYESHFEQTEEFLKDIRAISISYKYKGVGFYDFTPGLLKFYYPKGLKEIKFKLEA